jgi:predicted ribosomally synthesized peptide with nif11-like leader
MSMESAKLFIERLQTDKEFAGKITDCKDLDTLMIFETDSGFDFTDKELKKAYAELHIDDHNTIADGASPYPTVQILQAAMAHRESIRSNFESQREMLRKAIEEQRRAASGKK